NQKNADTTKEVSAFFVDVVLILCVNRVIKSLNRKEDFNFLGMILSEVLISIFHPVSSPHLGD
ncbi:MAG: hypothetical protein RL403_301, partial [Bacteroidota bacterium]